VHSDDRPHDGLTAVLELAATTYPRALAADPLQE
jgi:hypothetical protein